MSPVESISTCRLCRCSARALLGSAVCCTDRLGGVHFDRLRVSVNWEGREMGLRKVSRLRSIVIAAGTGYRLFLIEEGNNQPTSGPRGRETCGLSLANEVNSVLCALISRINRRTIASLLGMLTKWRQSTRLETRTKESNMYASIRVKNSGCAMKVRTWCDPVKRCNIDRS